jgi:NAD(P)H-nitrite reductase large subunit
MILDEKYHALELPGKFKMAVSGCHLSCAESWVRDVGLIGKKDGWMLTIGGNVGSNPRIGKELIENLSDDQALDAVEKVVAHYRENAKKGERLGKMIERLGLEEFKKIV